MSGIDHWLVSHFSGTASVSVIAAAAVLLGVRHATDPDHLTAIGNLIATGRDGSRRSATALGLAWGTGHGAILLAVGLPIVLGRVYLPVPVQRAAEAAVGLVIVLLAARLLYQWRRRWPGDNWHDLRRGGHRLGHGRHEVVARSPLQSFGIGALHGLAGSTAVTIMLLTLVDSPLVAAVGLGIFAVCAALSMTVLSTGLGAALRSGVMRRSFRLLAPVLGTASLGFGVWFLLGAATEAL